MTAASLALRLWAFFLAVCLVKSCWSVDWCAQCVLCSPQKKKKLQVWQDRKSDILEVKGWVDWWCSTLALSLLQKMLLCSISAQFRNIICLHIYIFSWWHGQTTKLLYPPTTTIFILCDDSLVDHCEIHFIHHCSLFKLKHIKIPPHGSSVLFRFVQFAGQKLQPWKQSHRI